MIGRRSACPRRCRVRGGSALAGTPAPGRLGRGRGLVRPRRRRDPGRARRRRRPDPADVHERHRVPPEGRDHDQPGADQPVRRLHRRRRDDVRRRRGPRPALLPLRPAALLPDRRRLPRRHEHRAARPRPGAPPADDRALRRDQAVLPADGVDRPAAPPGFDDDRPVVAAQGLLRRVGDAGRGPARAGRAPARTWRCWNFYGQTEMAPLATILQPHEQLTHIGSAGRASLNVETRIVDDDGQPVAAGHGRRDRPPQPAGHDRLLERPRAARPRRSPAAGSTPATSA